MKKFFAILNAMLLFVGWISIQPAFAASQSDATPSFSTSSAPLAIVPTDASAASAETFVDDCTTLSPADFAALAAVEDDATLTQTEQLDQELALRKKLLGQAISCALTDAQTLQATLAAAASSSTSAAAGAPDAQAVASQLSGNIDDAINFYNIESAKLNDAGVSATEAIAKEVLAWRAENYAPLEGDVNNFVLWSENQSLFATAQNRLTQTQRIVAFIEGAATANAGLDAALQTAQSSFSDATAENAAAGTALSQVQSPDQTLSMIQQSLQSLADTYQKFTDLNNIIQTLLPTSN